MPDVPIDRIHGFQSISRHTEHGRIFGRNLARGNQFLGDADGHATGCLSKNAFAFRQQTDCFANFVVGHVLCRATGFFHRFERVEAVCRCADRQGLGNGVWLDRLEEIESRFLGRGNGGASSRLRAVNLELGFVHQPQLDKFLVALLYLGQ